MNPPPQAEGGGGGVGAGNGRSPCVLKFWAGADMGLCIRAVDVAAQMPDGQQQRWASSGGGAGGVRARLPRLTAFAITPDASQASQQSTRVLCLFHWLVGGRGRPMLVINLGAIRVAPHRSLLK